MPLVEVEDLTVSFGGARAVAGVSFSIGANERFGVIGESGSGKSLSALAVAGLLPRGATAGGTIRFAGLPLPDDERAMARLRGKRIGFVFQEPMTALNPLMRIARQIAEAVELNQGGDAPQSSLEDLLVEVGLEAHHARRFPHELSGGQRQRALIAMALASHPDLLIADEPTSALDLIAQRRVLETVDAICKRRGMALLMISHDLRAVSFLCDRIIVMQQGRVVEEGLLRNVLVSPRTDYARGLIAASRLPASVAPAPVPARASLLDVRGLSRRFRQPGPLPFMPGMPFEALREVSFSLKVAESLALIGPSGCGKTTLARIVAGLDRASAGTLTFEGEDYHGADLARARRREISLVFQDPFASFNPRWTVGRSVGEPLRLIPRLHHAARARRIVEAVEAVGLSPNMLERYPHAFSGGQRQRLAIARALVTRPRLVVLDEPVSALDLSVRGEVLDLLRRLRAEFGLAYLFISHDVDVVRAVSDRVLVMDKGKIVEEGRPDALFAEPRHETTRALLEARLPEPGTIAEGISHAK